jgi:hypothetical protein
MMQASGSFTAIAGGNIHAAGGMRHAFMRVRRLCPSEACCGSHAIDHEIELQDGKEMFFI